MSEDVDHHFNEWYEANKEILTVQTLEGKLKQSFHGGHQVVDETLPILVTLLSMTEERYFLIPNDDGTYTAGVGAFRFKGPTAIGTLSRAIMAAQEDKNSPIIIAE